MGSYLKTGPVVIKTYQIGSKCWLALHNTCTERVLAAAEIYPSVFLSSAPVCTGFGVTPLRRGAARAAGLPCGVGVLWEAPRDSQVL